MPPSTPQATGALPTPPQRPRASPKVAGRRATLSQAAVVAAAIAVLDTSGLSGLSMRRVAEQLGTGAASLYGYVRGKDELLELVFDDLVGRVPLPDPDPATWREQVLGMLNELRAVLSSHRDAALGGIGRIPTSAKTLKAAEVLVAILRAGGLSDQAVALGFDQLILYVCAFAFEEGLYLQSDLSPDALRQYLDQVHAFYKALPPQQFPVLASIADDMTGGDADRRFDFGISVLLNGLERLSARGVESPPRTRTKARRELPR